MSPRRTTICLLLACIVLLPAFTALSWQWRQWRLKAVMHERLEHENLLTLHLPALQWFEEGKEILVEGRLFDVKQVEPGPRGGFVVTGLFDDAEKKLYAEAGRLAEQQNGTEGQEWLRHWVQLCWIDEAAALCTHPLTALLSHHDQYILIPADVCRRLATPPPERL